MNISSDMLKNISSVYISMNTPKHLSRTSNIPIRVLMQDLLTKEILRVIREAGEPIGTKGIIEQVKKKDKKATRTKVLLRLRELKGDKIQGKRFGSGKGAWVWWAK